MVNDLERKYNDGQSEEGSSMTGIMDETKKKKKVIMNQWLSPVTWDEEDEEDDEDDEDNNDTNDEDNNDTND
jgi:hypothetical protein